MNNENNSDSPPKISIEPTRYLLDRGVSLDLEQCPRGKSVMQFHIDENQQHKDVVEAGILAMLEADTRVIVFFACEEIGAVEQSSTFRKEETWAKPLRFNEPFKFIEPFIKIATNLNDGTHGHNWTCSEEWENAKFEVYVPKHDFGIKYFIEQNGPILTFSRNGKVEIPTGYTVKYFQRK